MLRSDEKGFWLRESISSDPRITKEVRRYALYTFKDQFDELEEKHMVSMTFTLDEMFREMSRVRTYDEYIDTWANEHHSRLWEVMMAALVFKMKEEGVDYDEIDKYRDEGSDRETLYAWRTVYESHKQRKALANSDLIPSAMTLGIL